jgi:RHS repeat-associated protein
MMKNELGLLTGDSVDNITHSLNTISYLTGNGNTEDGLYFYHGNHLSSTQVITDVHANISQAVLYTPWGSVIKEYKADWMLDTIPRYLFNGKELDEETGMYYYGARYYAAWLCRFVSCDPLQHEQPNKTPYHYCSNNPVNRIDPTGMQDEEKKPTSGLSINPNDTVAKADIQSLVLDSDNVNYIKFSEEGDVTLDFGELSQDEISKILKKDSGLKLIHDLNTTKNSTGEIPSYFYGTIGKTGLILERPEKQSKQDQDYFKDISDINSKSNARDEFGGYLPQAFILAGSVTPYSKNEESFGLKPNDGYDAKVFIGRGTFKQGEWQLTEKYNTTIGQFIPNSKVAF